MTRFPIDTYQTFIQESDNNVYEKLMSQLLCVLFSYTYKQKSLADARLRIYKFRLNRS